MGWHAGRGTRILAHRYAVARSSARPFVTIQEKKKKAFFFLKKPEPLVTSSI
jgi:hypothetical protein